jgi:hypothetical protein
MCAYSSMMRWCTRVKLQMTSNLPWSPGFWNRCSAVRERRAGAPYWGRCDLKRGHDGPHALERGFDTPRWSTDWISERWYAGITHND